MRAGAAADAPNGGAGVTEAAAGAAAAAAAAAGVLRRMLPRADAFELRLAPPPPDAPHGFFRASVGAGRVVIQGSSALELTAGAHWWLKHAAGCSVSWDATGGPQIAAAAFEPAALGALEAAGRVDYVRRAVPMTFYQNVVTQSYSMAFWEWERWERELDWMALQGINVALMPLGAEALWAETYANDFGLGSADLADWFPGPAFLAWGRMGNIQGWRGPLPREYMDKQLALGRRVVARMRELGIAPVYPAFAGFIPRALAAAHPGAAVTRASRWCRFAEPFCCPLMLDPQDPLFAAVGGAFVRRLRASFGPEPEGRPSYYTADSFNEMRPASADPTYLAAISGAVYTAMAAADPAAVWFMQAWLFFSDAAFWQPPQIKALLSGVPRGRLILLDLFADEHPVWSRTQGCYGYPYIWVMLHNFGGNAEMFGALPAVASGVAAALAASATAGAAAAAASAAQASSSAGTLRGAGGGNLLGVGMAPEGIEQNPAVYEFMAEMAYAGVAERLSDLAAGRSSDSSGGTAAAAAALGEWFEGYGRRRYGGAGPAPPPAAAALARAWRRLGCSAYSCSDGMHNTVCDIPTSRPGLSRRETTGWGLAPHFWYPLGELTAALSDLLAAATAHPPLRGCSSFRYDVIDAGREVASKAATVIWGAAAAAHAARDGGALAAAAGAMEALLADLDELLGAHKGWMLGPALARARAYADAGGSGLEESGGGSGGADSGGETEAAAAAHEEAEKERRRALGLYYEWNLRTQLTIWGTSDAPGGDSEVSDYANKQWAGLVSGFYAPRWAAWLRRLQEDVGGGAQYDAAAWRAECLALTHAWVAATNGAALPVDAAGDATALAARVLARWGGLIAAPPPLAEPEAAAVTAAAAAAEAAVGAAAAAAAAASAATANAAKAPAVAAAAAPDAPLSPVRVQQAVRA